MPNENATPSTVPADVRLVAPAAYEKPSSFRSGLNAELDSAAADAGLTGALVVGELTVLRGGAKTGRTAQLIEAAKAVLAQSKDHEVVIIAAPTKTSNRLIQRLYDAGVFNTRDNNRLIIGGIDNVTQLTYLVDNAVAGGHKVAALLVDDYGLLGGPPASYKTDRILTSLAFGRVAQAAGFAPAYEGYVPLTETTDEFPVLITLRRQPTQDLPMMLKMSASLVVSTDGEVSKSRHFQMPKQAPFYVDADREGMRTLWRRHGEDRTAVIVERDLPVAGRENWDRLVSSFTG